ncbi:hypothetical protein NC652_010667 [Populus alba x Populus x berolinensis]|uniref:Uncharacterized protein n=1 Tax=Populus alba x Populus x berolinensis TaxID=444605 RepID=A0AAD6R0I3_9ROSI|nr:hypothetical protein NC652_010667 [Populus alba x Populus x berolinensis]KAJ7000032.1 hypothetical protein NC653_010710 [Populus alba x Populus x berolinensis]
MKYNNLRRVRDTSGGENNCVEGPRASAVGYGDRQGKAKRGREESHGNEVMPWLLRNSFRLGKTSEFT